MAAAEEFGWAETVFTPFFMRFWFLEYYEGFALPEEPAYARVRAWRDASPAQRKRLVEEFRAMLVRTYSNAIDAYQGQEMRVLPSRNKRDFEDVPAEAREKLEFIWLETVDDAPAPATLMKRRLLCGPP